jgi:SAM-dependent methyltransferase
MTDDDRIQKLEARVALLENMLGGLMDTRASAERVDPVFYRLLEDRYRGSQDLVRERVEPYVTEIRGYRDTQIEAAREGFLVVDLGCGRGEMLAALNDAGIKAVGVERSAEQALEATASGLRVEVTDIFEYLASRGDGTIDVVIALHLIEHLSFARQGELLASAFRVLRPGGALIMETPNPENLRVGAWKLHIDPTHDKPLPPELLTLMVEYAGFTEIRVARLHPEPEFDQVMASGKLTRHAALMLYGPRDYVVLARKPR